MLLLFLTNLYYFFWVWLFGSVLILEIFCIFKQWKKIKHVLYQNLRNNNFVIELLQCIAAAACLDGFPLFFYQTLIPWLYLWILHFENQICCFSFWCFWLCPATTTTLASSFKIHVFCWKVCLFLFFTKMLNTTIDKTRFLSAEFFFCAYSVRALILGTENLLQLWLQLKFIIHFFRILCLLFFAPSACCLLILENNQR